MNKSTYHNALELFYSARTISPKPEIVGQVCPHLSKAEVRAIIANAKRTKSIYYFAIPPLLIDGVVGVACILPASEHKGKRSEASFHYGFTQKVDSKSVAYSERALNFARQHWNDALVADRAASYVTIYLEDPTKLDANGRPTTTAAVHFTTDRNWNDIMNDHSSPKSQVINDSILHLTSERIVAMELLNGRGGYTEYCCSHCGGGLGLTGCCACKHAFEDDGYRCGWSTPLPAKIIDYLVQQGHHFAADPAVAHKLGAASWKARVSKMAE